jgi:hypothetical protein
MYTAPYRIGPRSNPGPDFFEVLRAHKTCGLFHDSLDEGPRGAGPLPACQMIFDVVGDLLTVPRQLKQVVFDDRIVRLLGKFPIRGRLAP